MSVVKILNRAQTMGVRLSLSGDTVKLRGSATAIATIKPEISAHKPEIVRHLRAIANDVEHSRADCAGALRDPHGGLYLPWGPYLSPDDVRRMRADLAGMIERLSKLEGWPRALTDDVTDRAMRGPLADLLPNLAYFRERLDAAHAEAATRVALDRRARGPDGCEGRRLT